LSIILININMTANIACFLAGGAVACLGITIKRNMEYQFWYREYRERLVESSHQKPPDIEKIGQLYAWLELPWDAAIRVQPSELKSIYK